MLVYQKQSLMSHISQRGKSGAPAAAGSEEMQAGGEEMETS